MKKTWDAIRHALERLGGRREKHRRDRDLARRRRRRIVDWEELLARRPSARSADAPSGSRGCAFCAAVRGWVVLQWRRAAQAFTALGGRLAELAVAAGRRLGRREGRAPSKTPAGLFRRRAYPGSRTRRFELHVPPGCGRGAPSPLLVVLHGCRQTNADIRRISNFDTIADREGFVVAYPFITSYAGIRIRNCWGWWLADEIRPGAGEVEDLWQMIEQIRGQLDIDPRRIHVAGLSSGGGMAVAAMVAHQDRIASGAVVAGVPYSETPRAVAHAGSSGVQYKPTDAIVESMRSVMGPGGVPSPVFVVHSSHDPVVGIQAARNLRDSWAACHGIDSSRPATQKSGTQGGVAWVHARYRRARRRSAIETLFLEGPGHGWYGGNPGRFSFPDAPDTSTLMWRFFKRHPLYHDTLRDGGRARLRQAS